MSVDEVHILMRMSIDSLSIYKGIDQLSRVCLGFLKKEELEVMFEFVCKSDLRNLCNPFA